MAIGGINRVAALTGSSYTLYKKMYGCFIGTKKSGIIMS